MNYKVFKILITTTAIGAIGVLSSGCAPKLGGSDYKASSVGEISQVQVGTIASKRRVQINASEANQPGIGAIAGGLSGAALGSTIGQGKGSTIATVLGGLAGGFGGHAAEQALTSQEGYEYEVRFKDGSSVSITQGLEPELSVGQTVKVIASQKGRSRVVPA